MPHHVVAFGEPDIRTRDLNDAHAFVTWHVHVRVLRRWISTLYSQTQLIRARTVHIGYTKHVFQSQGCDMVGSILRSSARTFAGCGTGTSGASDFAAPSGPPQQPNTSSARHNPQVPQSHGDHVPLCSFGELLGSTTAVGQ